MKRFLLWCGVRRGVWGAEQCLPSTPHTPSQESTRRRWYLLVHASGMVPGVWHTRYLPGAALHALRPIAQRWRKIRAGIACSSSHWRR